jgi:cobalamin biosynthesis Mg chelatase CobN
VRPRVKLPGMSSAVLRRPAVAWILAALVAALVVAIVWAKVVQALRDAAPVPAAQRPTAIVWADRVFSSSDELAAWLHSRGGSYAQWSAHHPAAASVLEHRAPPQVTETTSGRPRQAATTAATRPRQAQTTAAAAVTTASAEPAASSAAAAVPRRPGRTRSTSSVPVGLILSLLALLCLVAAVVPAAVVARFPRVARWPAHHRSLLFACGATIAIGVLVGSVAR